MDNIKNCSLTVVGTGIKFISHLTTETRAYIEKSDAVLYLVNDPLMQEWLRQSNPNAESLEFLYTKFPLRLDCYRAITAYILKAIRTKKHVCAVFYGHPIVYSQSGLDAVKIAQKYHYDARVLPAISAEDCLFADLLVDPGTSGCQSYEATDFLIYKRQFNTSSHLILWQIGVVGIFEHAIEYDNKIGLEIILEYLKTKYSLEHEIILYEAAQYPSCKPRIKKIPLVKLTSAEVSRITTLYIPPASIEKCDEIMLQRFNFR